MKKRTGRLFILLFFVTAMAFSSPARAGKITPADEGENSLIHDIDILKTLNALKLSKEQLRQMVDIVREAVQKRDKTLKEIRAQLVLGKTMDELKELQNKLNNETEEAMEKLGSLLDEEQKNTLRTILETVPVEEVESVAPALNEEVEWLNRMGLVKKLGADIIEEETISVLLDKTKKALKDLQKWADKETIEVFAQTFFTKRTLELLKERLNAMK